MEEKLRAAIEKLREFENTEECEELIRVYGVASPEIADAAFEAEIYYPSILYRHASAELRDELIEILDKEDPGQLLTDKYLSILAEIGDNTVLEYFKKWEENPPKWRKNVYVGPSIYAYTGGWCIEDGKKRPLTYDICYALEKTEERVDSLHIEMDKEHCQRCGNNYVNLITIDGADQRLAFLGINGKVKVKICYDCIPYEDYICCRYEENGESTVIYPKYDGTVEPPEEFDFDTASYKLSAKEVHKCYCSEWEGSVIGGEPAFIDDSRYIVCPQCGKHMMHIVQLDGAYTGYGDGTMYVQICKECQLIAVFYQHT